MYIYALKDLQKIYKAMARLSISVLKHHQRIDGTFPVFIKLSHKSKSVYIDIHRIARENQVIMSKHKSIVTIKEKEGSLLRLLLNTLKEYEDALAEVKGLGNYSVYQLKTILVKKVDKVSGSDEEIDFLAFVRDKAQKLKSKGKKEWGNYRALANNLSDFIQRPVLFVSEINHNFLAGFSSYLQTERIVKRCNQGEMRERVLLPSGPGGVYAIMKDFRTAFNDMKNRYNDEDTGCIPIPHSPFKKFTISAPLTNPRGLLAAEIADLYCLYNEYDDMLYRERLGLDMFFLSFFLIGINTVDLYLLKKEHLSKGRITYNRQKTKDRRKDGALISIKVEQEAMRILKRYMVPEGSSLLNLSYSNPDTLTRAINKGLESLCEKNGLQKVTMYVARHSWATIARNECGVSKDDISVCLNHSDPARKTTDIYIKTDWSIIDRANRKVIDYLFSLVQQGPDLITSSPLLK